jgi:uncharacterized RDD family membrane protein YckC
MAYDAVAVVVLLMAATALAMLAGFRELSALRDPLYAVFLLAVWCLYFLWCWGHGGMTLGMRAWNVRIEMVPGGLPGWRPCLARFLAAWLSAAALGAGFAWALFDPQRSCWHDRLSGTRLYRS